MKRKILTALIILIVFYFLSIGHILVHEDKIRKCDAAVVLNGEIPSRILQGIDMYEEGYVNEIIMSNLYVADEVHKLLDSKGFDLSDGADNNKDLAIQAGVPDEDIIILNGNARSTIDESQVVGEYFSNNSEYKSIMIVTSKYHSYRASKIFENQFKKLDLDIEIISVPTKYEEFDSYLWFTDRESIDSVIFETIKLTVFYLIEQW